MLACIIKADEGYAKCVGPCQLEENKCIQDEERKNPTPAPPKYQGPPPPPAPPISNPPTAYDALGLPSNVDDATITLQYKRMMQKIKSLPRNNKTTNLGKLIEIAYKSLTPPEMRAKYDEALTGTPSKVEPANAIEGVIAAAPT
jgi:hypothetical protein